MEKITGLEAERELPAKVLLIYRAVEQLIEEGQDLNTVKVSTITEKAGIGKGTVYDYFETKDEIIACALLYQIKKMSERLAEDVAGRDSFADKINFLLDEIEQEKGRRHSFIRFVHILTDNASFCQLVRQKMASEKFKGYLPARLFADMVKEAMEKGEIKREFPVEYVISCVCSRMFMYMVSHCTEDCFHTSPASFRPYIFQGIMDELCEKNV